MTASALRRVLGDDFTRLHPRLQDLLGASRTVHADGVFDTAGTRARALAPLLAVTARWGVLFPEHERDVPFTVSMTITPDRITTERRFRFAARTRILRDESRLVAGGLVDVHATRLLVRMKAVVETDGSLRLSSKGSRLRIGRLLAWVPPVRIDVHQWWDEPSDAHRIRVIVRLPLAGEIFGYRGRFHTLPDRETI